MVASDSFKEVLRQLDREARVLCDTIRSPVCNRCSHCRRDTPTRNIIVQHPPHSSQPGPSGDPVDDSPFPDRPTRDITITERDKQLLADLRTVYLWEGWRLEHGGAWLPSKREAAFRGLVLTTLQKHKRLHTAESPIFNWVDPKKSLELTTYVMLSGSWCCMNSMALTTKLEQSENRRKQKSSTMLRTWTQLHVSGKVDDVRKLATVSVSTATAGSTLGVAVGP